MRLQIQGQIPPWAIVTGRWVLTLPHTSSLKRLLISFTKVGCLEHFSMIDFSCVGKPQNLNWTVVQ